MKTCEICAAVIPDPTSSVFYCTTKKEYVNLTCGCGTVIYGEKAAIAEGDRNA